MRFASGLAGWQCRLSFDIQNRVAVLHVDNPEIQTFSIQAFEQPVPVDEIDFLIAFQFAAQELEPLLPLRDSVPACGAPLFDRGLRKSAAGCQNAKESQKPYHRHQRGFVHICCVEFYSTAGAAPSEDPLAGHSTGISGITSKEPFDRENCRTS